ncbi:MAG: hypothetical protein ABSB84_03550 [Verrucomicrobiota bacterium]|jgi:hypothetical protein
MSLLREIQDAAIDGSTDLETLLRKCRVLAARLKNEQFKQWVQSELDGYSSTADVPDYRKFHCQCFGHFSGPFGSGLKNAPIPESCIPAEIREGLTNIVMGEGVGPLKNLLDGGKDDTLTSNWPADACALFGRQIYRNMNLMQAWMVMSKSSVVGILSTVRNRILNFAIEIEATNPDAGEAAPGSIPVPKEKVSQIFNTYIYGTVGNVASGHDIQQAATVNVQQGDFQSLASYLKEQGVDDAEVLALKEALKSEPKPSPTGFGKKVSTWMGKMLQKSAEGTWKVGTTVAANLLTSAIKSYYGIP